MILCPWIISISKMETTVGRLIFEDIKFQRPSNFTLNRIFRDQIFEDEPVVSSRTKQPSILRINSLAVLKNSWSFWNFVSSTSKVNSLQYDFLVEICNSYM